MFKSTSARKIKLSTKYAKYKETFDLNETFVPVTDRLLDTGKRIYDITLGKCTDHKRKAYVKVVCIVHNRLLKTYILS